LSAFGVANCCCITPLDDSNDKDGNPTNKSNLDFGSALLALGWREVPEDYCYHGDYRLEVISSHRRMEYLGVLSPVSLLALGSMLVYLHRAR
jgi:hypothetical protein